MADDFLKGFEYVGEYRPPSRDGASSSSFSKPDDLLSDFEYVKDVPTTWGQVQEGGTAALREAGRAAVSSPLKGASVFETFREKVVDTKLKEEIGRQFERYRDNIRPGDRVNSVRELRRIANLYLEGDQKKELWDLAGKLDKGEVPTFEKEEQAKKTVQIDTGLKPSERPAFKIGEATEKFLEEKLPTTKGYEETIGVQLGGAIGSTGGTIAQSLLGGPVTALAGSALMGVDEQFDRATKAGLSEDEAVGYALQGAGPGAIGTLSAEFILRKLPPKVRNRLLRSVADLGLSAGSEAVTEGLQQTIQNAIEQQYNKDRDIFDGTIFSAAMGGGAGLVLRGIVLGATRGRGVGADGGADDPVAVQQRTEAVQRELAEEELKLRKTGGEAETRAPDEQPSRTPEEAARKGEIKEAGEPATLTVLGNRMRGVIRNRREDGGFDFFDQDGTKTTVDPADLKGDEETGTPPIIKFDLGWKNDKTDEEIEEGLKDWLEGKTPWVKKTIELEDGTKFKAIEGPPDAAGNRVFRDGNANLRTYSPDVIDVSDDWDGDALEAPDEPQGEISASRAMAETVTQEDSESPIPTDLIAEGKGMMAETEGAGRANTVLRDAGLPPVGTPVQFLRENGEAVRGVIDDASEDYVKVLSAQGEILDGKISQIAPRIAQIPASQEAVDKSVGKSGDEASNSAQIQPPPFLAARTVRNTQESVQPSAKTGQGGVLDFLYDPGTLGALERGEVRSDQGARQEGSAGVERGESARDQAQYGQGQAVPAQAGVRDTEIQGEAQGQEKVTPQGAQQPKPRIERRVENVRQAQQEGRQYSKERQAEGQNARGQRRISAADQGRQDEGAKKTAREEVLRRKEQPPPKPREEAPTAPISPPPQDTASLWWDRASIQDKRAAAKRAGYSESKQVDSYVDSKWQALPDATRELIRRGNKAEIEKSGKKESVGGKGAETKPEKEPGGESARKESVAKPVADKKAAVKKRTTKKEYDAAKKEAIRAQLRAELNSMGLKDVKLETPDSIDEIDGSKAINDKSVAVGRSRSNLIEVALGEEGDPFHTLRHEAIHAMRNLGLFTKAEWRTLENEARSNALLMDDIRDRYAGERLSEEALVEEGVADLYADYVDGLYKPKGFIKSAFEKIRNFLKALRNALRGNGFKAASDVFADIEAGRIGERTRVAHDKPSHVAISEAEVDRALRQFDNPLEGLVSPTLYAKVRRHDDKIVRDLGWLRKWTITPRTIASFSKSFSKVYVAAKRQFAHRDQIISDLAVEYTPYRNLKSKSKANVNKVLELGRLEQKEYRPNANGEITVTATSKTGLMEAGETVTLSADEAAGYLSVRRMMDKALDEFRDQTVRDFGFDPAQIKTARQALALIQRGMTKAEKNTIRTMAKMIHDIEQSRRTGYVPFSRFGNVVVVAEKIDPVTGKSTTLHSETVEVTGITGKFKERVLARGYISRHPDVKRIVKELNARYPGANIRHFQVASQEDTRPDNARDILSELIQLSPQDMEQRVKELHTKAMASGFRKHFFAAKNIPGYSLDIERSVADYVITMGSFVARRAAAKEWNDAINAIPSNKPKEKDYARRYHEYVNSPVEEFAAIRQLGFITFLAGNVSNALANATQVPLVSAPYLNMFTNTGRVAFELSRAYKDVTKMLKADVREIFNPDRAPIDVRAALKQAWAEGQFTPLAMHEIMGVAYHARPSQRALSAAGGKLLDRIAYPQTSTERMNRLVTYIAAYRLANSNPTAFEAKARPILQDNALAAETVLKNFSPSEFARYVVDETQFDVGKVNRAKISRGIGAAITQFKPFVFNTLELHAKLIKLHGVPGNAAWASMVAALMVSAGMFAPPASEDMVALLEWALKWWDGVDRDIKLGARQWVAEMTGSPFVAELASKGVFRYAGIDASNRIGMGKIFPRTSEELGGVPISIVWGRGEQILSNAKEGRWEEAFLAASPLMIKNMAEPWVWKHDGVRTRFGDPVMTPDEITPWMMVSKSIGFNPREVAERREMEWSQQRASKAVGDLQAKYYRRLARVLNDAGEAESDEEFSKHMDKYEEILMDIDEHNNKVIDKDQTHKLIIIDNKTLKKRMAAEVVGRGTIREAQAPKKARARMQEIREIYGAD